MNVPITEITLSVVQDGNVVGYGSITLGGEWAIRNIRVIRRTDGTVFVAMPSEETTARCAKCQLANRISAAFCNRCGGSLPPNTANRFRDLAFPVNKNVRSHVEMLILAEYARLSGTVVMTAAQTPSP